MESHIYRMHVNINRDIIPQPQPGICVSAIEIDTLEYQQTEKIGTELRDVDRIRIRKVYACCPGLPSLSITGLAALDGQYHSLSGTYFSASSRVTCLIPATQAGSHAGPKV